MTEETIFFDAHQKPSAERAAFLDRACAGDAALRRRVETLLRAHDNPASFMARPAADLAATADPQTAAETGHPRAGRQLIREGPGAQIGPYKLVEQIGEGGMGTVFMAEQTRPLRRQVALKVIKAGMDTRQVIARFEAERQALALMDHPNIAKVLEAGTTDSGRPYFVMELVKGVPITDYCDQARLTPRQRLELFVPVCNAVQHAHQKGVIHRDLKPSNILVTLHDDKLVPKVIDFGIAKATGQQLIDKTLFTHDAQMLGTPLYMSPEQAQLSGLDVDTRSDIYSLGVLLYELLTGTTPFDSQRLREAAYDEMRRIIREEDPPKPSTRLSGSETLPSVAASRHTEPGKLPGLVRGELDWVVMKALEKDRARRYETAGGFARDVERFLSHEPVAAGPQGAGYRLRKFVRRNRPQVVAASLVLLALLAGFAGTAFGLVRATRAAEAERLAKVEAEGQKENALRSAAREADERKKAEAARAEAQANAAEANAVVRFFQDKVFSAGRPKGQEGGLGHDVSLRDAIRASLPSLRTSFEAQPLVEARLRLTLGTTFSYLGDHAQAAEQCERARALYTRHRGPDDPDTLASMNDLANSYSALNRQAEALKLREETLAARKRVLAPDHPRTLRSMRNLAISYSDLNRHAEALKLREETLAAQKRVLAPDHPDTLGSMNDLAISYWALNRQAEALCLTDYVLARADRPGVDSRRVSTVIRVHLYCCRELGDVARYRVAVELLEKQNPTDAAGLYNAACWRAGVAWLQSKTPGADAARLAAADADQAMAWLTKAVAAGWTDAARMRKDTDLDPLRGRADFQKLLAGLADQAATKPQKQP